MSSEFSRSPITSDDCSLSTDDDSDEQPSRVEISNLHKVPDEHSLIVVFMNQACCSPLFQEYIPLILLVDYVWQTKMCTYQLFSTIHNKHFVG